VLATIAIIGSVFVTTLASPLRQINSLTKLPIAGAADYGLSLKAGRWGEIELAASGSNGVVFETWVYLCDRSTLRDTESSASEPSIFTVSQMVSTGGLGMLTLSMVGDIQQTTSRDGPLAKSFRLSEAI